MGAAAAAGAQAPVPPLTHYIHDSWQIEQGLPQNTVQAIAQTADGYLWLGTQEGLVRFDGMRFTVFDRQRVPELRSNNIQALFVDRDDRLWIGTETGGALQLDKGRFTAFAKPEGLAADAVRAFHQTADGALWTATFGGALQRFEGRRFAAAEPLRTSRLSSLSSDRSGHVWVGTYDAGVIEWSSQGVTAHGPANGLADDVRAVRVDRTGVVWAGTRHGVARYIGGRWVPLAAALPADTVTALYEDRAGAMWIGTSANGLYRYAAGVLDRFGVTEGLSASRVRAVFEDREGNIWTGTEGGGLNRLRRGTFITYGRQDGLSSDIAYAIFQDRHGAVWVGTQQNGLNRWDGDRFTSYTTADGLPADTVLSLADAPDGSLWIGTEGGGIARYQSGRFQPLLLPGGMRIASAYALHRDKAGCMWIGTSGQGLLRTCGDQLTRFSSRDGLGSDIVFAVASGADGAIWAGTYGGGLSRYRDGRMRTFTTRDGLGSDTIFAIHPDADGTVWIGTNEGGLSRIRNDTATTFTARHGLLSETIFQVLDDGRGHLWMSSNKGVSRVSKDDLEAIAGGRASAARTVAYGKSDGMGSAECNGAVQPAGWRMKDGRLWFPTIKGVAIVDPSTTVVAGAPPPVSIESLVADMRPVELSRDGAPALLPAGVSNIEIQYVGLNLATPQTVRYRYRLDGYDAGWIDVGSRRAAYYTHLGPGRYRFRVTAANSDGLWEETGPSLVFAVAPHFYQTWWFGALCVLALIAAVTITHDVRVRHIKRDAVRLQRLVDERTASLEDANHELARLATLDGLMGIANRRRFEEVLDAEWRRAARARSPLSCILVDVDYFGDFNEQYKHLAGDRCLQAIAGVLTGVASRAADLVARYGGDELIILLPDSPLPGAQQIAERIRAGVEALAIPHAASAAAPIVTVTAGVATMWPEPEQDPHAVVASADEALYRAKHAGRNRVEVNDPSPLP